MNKFYRQLDLPEFNKIQEKLVPLVLDIVHNRKDKLRINQFSQEEYTRLQEKIPEFFSLVKKILNSEIHCCVFLYYDEEYPNKNTAHSDIVEKDFVDNTVPDCFFRLNWPILNPDSFETVFFEVLDPSARFYDKRAEAYKFDENKLRRVETLLMSKPSLVNIKEVHGIYRVKENNPRILLAIRPINGSSKHLQDIICGKKNPVD